MVDTPGHGYYVLAWNLNKDDVMGLIIGEEDGGIDEVWQKKLGWKHEHCKDPADTSPVFAAVRDLEKKICKNPDIPWRKC